MPDIVGDGDNLGDHIATKGFKQIKGGDIASADAITLGTDGNTFDITGTTTVNHFNTTNWAVGSVVVLHFDGALTITHNAGSLSGAQANILLSGDENHTTTAGDILTFVLHDSTTWQEIARNSGTISAIADVGDVTISGIASGEILKWNGSAWINQTLAETGIASSTLNSAQLYVGNGSNVATGVALSGDASITNAGAISVSDLTISGETAQDLLYYNGSNWVRLAKGTDGQVLKTDSGSLAWGSGGGGATIVHTYTNTTNTSYLGTASSFGNVGVGDRDIYIKKIDSNNEGVYTKIWKNGSAVEVQIA
jgi:hypothetical protein